MHRVVLEESTTVVRFGEEQHTSNLYATTSTSPERKNVTQSNTISVEPDGRFLYIDIQNRSHQGARTIDGAKKWHVTVLVFHPQQSTKAAIGMSDGRVFGLDFTKNQIFLVSYFLLEPIVGITFDEILSVSPLIICATEIGNIYTVNWETGTRIQAWSLTQYHQSCARQLLFYNSLLVCSSDDRMSCWKMNPKALQQKYEFYWSSPSLESLSFCTPSAELGYIDSEHSRPSDAAKWSSFGKVVIVNTGIITAVGTKCLTRWSPSESSPVSGGSELQPVVCAETPFSFRHIGALFPDYLVVLKEEGGCNIEWAILEVETLEGVHRQKLSCSHSSLDITDISIIFNSSCYFSSFTCRDDATELQFLALSFRNGTLAVIELWSGTLVFEWEFKPLLSVIHSNCSKNIDNGLTNTNIVRKSGKVSNILVNETNGTNISLPFLFLVSPSATLSAVQESNGRGIWFVHFPTFLEFHKCKDIVGKQLTSPQKVDSRPNSDDVRRIVNSMVDVSKVGEAMPWWFLAHSETSTQLAKVVSYRPLLSLRQRYFSQWVDPKSCDLTAITQRNLLGDIDSNCKMMSKVLFEEDREFFRVASSDPIVRYAEKFQRLRSHLALYGSFPAPHRPVIWRFALGLPPQSQTAPLFASLERKQSHHCVPALMEAYPLPHSQSVIKRRIERALSALAWHSPVFGILDILPAIIYPFAQVFDEDVQTLTEVMMLVFMNWGKEFFSYYPQAPPDLMTFLTQLLREEDQELYLHLQKISSPVEVWGWEIAQVFYTDSISASEWVQLMDHALLMVPLWLMVFHVCFLKSKREQMLSCRTSLEVLQCLQGDIQETCSVPFSRVIQETYHLYLKYNFPTSPSSSNIFVPNHNTSFACSPIIVCPTLYTFFESIYPLSESEWCRSPNSNEKARKGSEANQSVSMPPFLSYRTRYLCDNDVLRERTREIGLRAQRLIDLCEAQHRRAVEDYQAQLDALQGEYSARQTQQLYHAKCDAMADASQSGIHLAKTRKSIVDEMGVTDARLEVPILSPPFLNHPYGQELLPKYPLPTPIGRVH